MPTVPCLPLDPLTKDSLPLTAVKPEAFCSDVESLSEGPWPAIVDVVDAVDT